ncbi:hypothetical protein BJ166DRAFT_521788 [Pestalotiopsis sp. NC0098]|nr:hypothetical protein BJ166DRAFT_521788 [Pestalotiopsis sp. NC0098]
MSLFLFYLPTTTILPSLCSLHRIDDTPYCCSCERKRWGGERSVYSQWTMHLEPVQAGEQVRKKSSCSCGPGVMGREAGVACWWLGVPGCLSGSTGIGDLKKQTTRRRSSAREGADLE